MNNLTKDQLDRLNVILNEPRVPEAGLHKHNFINSLMYFLTLAKPKNIIEIGCYKGVSTEVFCLLVDKVTVVDPFIFPQAKVEFLKRMEPYKDKLTVIEGFSPKALAEIPDGSFDMCYVDGDHNLQPVLDDITVCKRIVKHGGILAGHDWDVVPQVNAGVILSLGGLYPDMILQDSTWVAANNIWRNT